jgi:lysozyme
MVKRNSKTKVRVKSKKEPTFFYKVRPFLVGAFVLMTLFAAGYHYRNGLAYYFGFKSDKLNKAAKEKQRLSDVRNYTLLSKYKLNPIGIDISEYQGIILWDSVRVVENDFPVRFIFIRATVGMDRLDKKFAENWKASENRKYIRGAYHYYRPNENSSQQANLYIENVVLQKGDFPPVLDIEQLPKKQSLAQLKVGLRNWLHIIEDHYGVKPIIYSGERFYKDFLKDDFSEYTFWIANYNFFVENLKPDWRFWQFTEKGAATGISNYVDVNIFNGTETELRSMTLGNGAFVD